MAVLHIDTDVVHKGSKGGTTGCGTDTKDHPSHWTSTTRRWL